MAEGRWWWGLKVTVHKDRRGGGSGGVGGWGGKVVVGFAGL